MNKRYDGELTPDELAALPGDKIDYEDIPELGDEFWKNARIREPDTTQQVTLRIKKSVLAAFRSTGKGYRTRMGAALESYARHLQRSEDDKRS